jgi:hypothetical protein
MILVCVFIPIMTLYILIPCIYWLTGHGGKEANEFRIIETVGHPIHNSYYEIEQRWDNPFMIHWVKVRGVFSCRQNAEMAMRAMKKHPVVKHYYQEDGKETHTEVVDE